MTTTTATTATGQTATQAATRSLLTSLGTGSGVDTNTLVGSLVEAQFAARNAQLTARADKLTAQISGVSTIKAAVSGFATALESLAKGGTLATQPRLSTAGVLSATALPGAKLSTAAASVRVDRLAAAQVVASPKAMANGSAASRTTPIGSGSFTLQLGSATYATETGTDGATRTVMSGFAPATGADTGVTFTLADASVDGIAAAINAQGAKLGITAAVVTGADGAAFLSLKGATGTASGFTLTTTGDAALEQFAVGAGTATTIAGRAQNAALVVDGVPVERSGNTIDDLVPGMSLELTATGTTTLTTTRPTAALAQAVTDVVETYNEVLKIIGAQTDAKTGTLFGDPAAQTLLRSLRGLTLARVNPAATGAAPATLAELGVRTEKDGTLVVDQPRLTKMLATQPDAAEAIFVSAGSSTTGLPAVLKAIAATATATGSGLGSSTSRYTAAQGEVTTAQAKVSAEAAAMTTRLGSQFSAMNTRVTAYKSVQGFLTNQIAAWNKSDS